MKLYLRTPSNRTNRSSRMVAWALGLCVAANGLFAERPAVKQETPESIRGAIYISSEAYNAPQMWKNFDLNETRRDFGYAKKVGLNALRVWASYEYWRMEPERF